MNFKFTSTGNFCATDETLSIDDNPLEPEIPFEVIYRARLKLDSEAANNAWLEFTARQENRSPALYAKALGFETFSFVDDKGVVHSIRS